MSSSGVTALTANDAEYTIPVPFCSATSVQHIMTLTWSLISTRAMFPAHSSDALCAALQVPSEAILSLPFSTLVHADDRPLLHVSREFRVRVLTSQTCRMQGKSLPQPWKVQTFTAMFEGAVKRSPRCLDPLAPTRGLGEAQREGVCLFRTHDVTVGR